MSWNGWATHSNGDIKVFPVTGWSTAAFKNGMAGGLRLEYATDPTLKTRDSLQLVLTLPQTTDLIGTLEDLAGKLKTALAADKPTGPIS